MSIFEFLMVLVSLIIGLGIAEVLTGITRMIRSRDTIQTYWVHSMFLVIVFIALLQQWWEIWGVVTILLAVSFRPLILGTKLLSLDNLSSFLMATIFISLTITKKSWFHGTMVTLVLAGLLSDVMLVGFVIE